MDNDYRFHLAQPGAFSVKFIIRHSWSGIAHAILMVIFWPTTFFRALLYFLFLRPFHTVRLGKFVLATQFLDPHDRPAFIGDPAELDRTLVTFGFYVFTLLLTRFVSFVWRCTIWILWLLWSYPVFSVTIFVALLPACALVSRFVDWQYLDGRLAGFIDQANNSMWRTRVTVSSWFNLISNSEAISLFRYCAKVLLERLLQRTPAEQREDFTYQALEDPKKQIRLLQVQQRLPFLDVEAKLIHYNADTLPAYEAISYTWGVNPESSHSIILHGKKHRVPVNVFNILRRCSSRLTPRLIWIDSICVNQADYVEKADQVRMMLKIYKGAFRVLVCLGESPGASLAVSVLNQLTILKWKLGLAATANYFFSLWHRRTWDEILDARLTAFLDLLDHPWFERVWVIQEVVVARSVTVIYGNEVLMWDYFKNIQDIMFGENTSEVTALLKSSKKRGAGRQMPFGLTHLFFMDHTRHMFQRDDIEPLSAILQRYIAFKATEPRDKIFALLDLTEAAEDLAHLIDYQKPMANIFIEVANHIREQGDLLKVLQFAGIGWDRTTKNIPSWTVDWSMSHVPTPLAHTALDYRLQYRAAVGRPAKILQGKIKRIIRVQGQLLGCISAVGSPLEVEHRPTISLFDDLEAGLAWLEQAQTLAQTHAKDPYPASGHQSLQEAFWRTLIGDRTRVKRPAPAMFGGQWDLALTCLRKLQTLQGVCGGDFSLLNESQLEQSGYTGLLPSWEALQMFQRELLNTIFLFGHPGCPRRFCVTAKKLMGMVPHKTRIGDIICIIHGAQVPFVLRPLREVSKEQMNLRYQLVGECYIHGMMDGEGLTLGDKTEMLEIL